MTYLDRHMQQRISDLVATCANYWELRGIAPERRREMRLELAQHLAQAVADGTSLEGVSCLGASKEIDIAGRMCR